MNSNTVAKTNLPLPCLAMPSSMSNNQQLWESLSPRTLPHSRPIRHSVGKTNIYILKGCKDFLLSIRERTRRQRRRQKIKKKRKRANCEKLHKNARFNFSIFHFTYTLWTKKRQRFFSVVDSNQISFFFFATCSLSLSLDSSGQSWHELNKMKWHMNNCFIW